jgi:hypothetical protein
MTIPRWDRCIYQRGPDAKQFVAEYLARDDRRLLLIGGAGFDPRSPQFCETLASHTSHLTGLFLREERPVTSQQLADRALANSARLQASCPTSSVLQIQIFAKDGAVIGGREVVKALKAFTLTEYTDVIVDMSSLSKGISFPTVRYLIDSLGNVSSPPSVHLFVTEDADTDGKILEVASDRTGLIAGFAGDWGLEVQQETATLWLPQLMKNQHRILDMIYKFVNPDDTCPILPFPTHNPRQPDELIEEYRAELQSTWEVEHRDLVYANERNPLDLYRTILRLDDARRRVFQEVGGSQIVLSPLGSKVLAMGAMLAALDRNFPVAYVEAIDYKVDPSIINGDGSGVGDLVHLCLSGTFYETQNNKIT